MADRTPAALPSWVPNLGERVFIVGQTGSGKTTFATRLLQELPDSPIIVYDTKEEPKFESLPNARVVWDMDGVYDAVDDVSADYIIFRPPAELTGDWQALDDLLFEHYLSFRGVGAYIDELADFHNKSVFGKGLANLYRKGRARGITTIAATQRPAWISQFSMSESQQAHIFYLAKNDDRKRIRDNLGLPVELPNPPKHHHWLFRTGDSDRPAARLIAPVSLPPGSDPGYTDPVPADPIPNPTTDIGHVWLGPREFFSWIR